jgi:chloramphenicol 3-O phosphotransferase
MPMNTKPGQIVILNGAPRAGKSSIAAAIQDTFDGPWLNIGVDALKRATSQRYQPGIGLRPGGERADLEPFVVAAFVALYDSLAVHSVQGLNVVADVGHHDAYSKPLGILELCASRLRGLPVLFVGVRCPLEEIMLRRARADGYALGTPETPVPEPVRLWQEEVHRPGVYDLDVDTSLLTPRECAAVINQRLRDGPPGNALERIARSRRSWSVSESR